MPEVGHNSTITTEINKSSSSNILNTTGINNCAYFYPKLYKGNGNNFWVVTN
jgi:hypothetical protein